MKRFRRIINDLKSGKNAEVYITLGICIFIMLLDLLNIIEQEMITAAILLVLGLLAFSNLNSRHDFGQLSEALKKLEIGGCAKDFFKKRRELPELIEKATCIDLSILAGTSFLTESEFWERKLKEGANIRVILANPCDDEHICTLTAKGDLMTEGKANELQRDILRVANRLISLEKKNYPGKMELKFHTIVPSFGIFAINPHTSKGIIKIELYPYHTSIYSRPHFFLKYDQDGEWYEMFRDQFEIQWKIATDFDSIKNSLKKQCAEIN